METQPTQALTLQQQVNSAIQQMNLPMSLQTCTPNNIFDTFSAVATVPQALAAGAPSLLALSRSEGSSSKKVFGLLQLHLMLLSHNAKVKQGLSKMEIDLLAGDILHDFHYLTFADIAVILRRFYHGDYGPLYGSLSSADVYQWFKAYASERCETAYQQNVEADRARHSASGGNDALATLSYSRDPDTGVLRIDPRKVAARNRPRPSAGTVTQQETEALQAKAREQRRLLSQLLEANNQQQ